MIYIRKALFQECVDLESKIPEFNAIYKIEEYKNRCKKKYLPLIAEIENQPVGFKIGYDRFKDGSFYSWMGGVLLKFRRKGVASSLANFQEKWATRNGFTSIILKTRAKYNKMIKFSLNQNFIVLKEAPNTPAKKNRIWMQKSLIIDKIKIH